MMAYSWTDFIQKIIYDLSIIDFIQNLIFQKLKVIH